MLIFPFAPSVIVIVPESVPEFVSKTKSFAPEVVILPDADPLPITTSPVPLFVKEIFPLAASVIVIDEESVPSFVFKIKSAAPPVVTVSAPAPFEIILAAAPASPT